MFNHFYLQHEIKQFAKECYQLLLPKIIPLDYLKKRYHYNYLDCENENKVIILLKKSLINTVLFPHVFQKMTQQQKKLLLLSFVDDLATLFNNTCVKVTSYWQRLAEDSAPYANHSGYKYRAIVTLDAGIILQMRLAEPLIDDIAALIRSGIRQLITKEFKYINLMLITKHFKRLNAGLNVTYHIQSFIENPRVLLNNYPRLNQCRYADLLMIRKLELQKFPINSQAKEKIKPQNRHKKQSVRELMTFVQSIK